MRRRSVFLLAALAAALSALVLGLLRRGHGREDAFELAAPSPGREAVLHVTWHEKSTARLPAGQAGEGQDGTLTGELDLEADLALSRERTTDDHDAIRAELRDVRASHVVVSGSEVLRSDAATAKSLERRPIHLVVEDGRVVRVLVDRESSSLTVQLVENVARQVLLARPQPGGAPFEREERTQAGTLRVRYEPRGDVHRRTVVAAVALEGLPDTCEGTCVVRARGEGEVRFESGGAVASLTDTREIHAGVPGAPALLDTRATFEAKRASESEVATAALDIERLASKLPGEVFESEADRRASLTRLAGDATVEDVIGGVTTAAASGPKGLEKGWLVRSTALLELHPELIAEVAIRFQDDDLGTQGRTAILDLLAATGGDAAQAALLRTLDTAAARQDESRLLYVQRLLLVEEPNAATARALRERMGKSNGAGDAELAYAEAHVLGAVAGRLEARGAHGEARASIDVLAGALDKATAPAPRAAYLSALGNAGDPAQVPRITKHARDEDPNVRRAVASALRKTKDPAARHTLVALARDPNEEVQIAAVSSLGQHPIEPGEQRELAQLLDAPQLGGEAEAQLTTVLLRQGPPSPEIRGSLEHLLARTEDPRLAARIRFAFEAAGRAN